MLDSPLDIEAPETTLNNAARTVNTGLAGLSILFASASAAAYLSPGSGLGAFSVLLGSIGVVFLVIVGFFWYPIKRMLARLQGEPGVVAEAESEAESAELPDSTENPSP